MHPFEWDIEGNVVLALPGFARLFGLPPDEPLTYQAAVARIHPDDRARVDAAYQEAVRTRRTYEQEYRVVLPDGAIRCILARGEVVFDDEERPRALAGVVLDITRRKEAELALAQREAELSDSERRFRVLADAMPQMVWTTLPDGHYDYFNQRWYDFTGVPEGSTYDDKWAALFHPDDRDRLWARWRHSLRTGEPYEIECRLRHRSGEYHWVLGRALPLWNEHGAIERWFGTCTDIHDLKQAQEALAKNEEFTSRLLSSTDDCITVLDLEGRLRFMNEGGMRVMEVGDFRAIEGSHWSRFWSGPTALQAMDAIEAACAGGTGRFQGFCPTLAGTPKWWDVLVTSIKGPDGRPERLLWISRDVTERKRAEDRIAETLERYRLAARATNDVIWDWNALTDHVLWNEAMQAVFGYAPEEVEPSRQWWMDHIRPEDRDRVEREIRAAIDGPSSHVALEYRFQKADGSYAVVFDRGFLLRDPNGDAVRAIGAMFDITERKRLEDQQALISRELHHRIKNTLTMAQALISSTARHARTIAEFQQAVSARITLLAKTQELLIERDRCGASIRDILKFEMEPYDGKAEQRLRFDGPDVRLPSEPAVTFAMAVHELTTNAVKYGALSIPTGHVDVDWSVEVRRGKRKLTFEWRERDGPPVRKPDRQGFGSVLLKRVLARQLDGEVEMDFAPDGLKVRIAATLPDRPVPPR